MDIKGSGAISDLADNCFTIWRNKRPNANGNDYDAKLSCHKQGNGDWEGDIYLWFDINSYMFSEKINVQSEPFVVLEE